MVIGASLSEPHIDHDSSSCMYVCMYVCVYVCIYVSNIFTCICRTLVPKIHVRTDMLHVFWYIDVLM